VSWLAIGLRARSASGSDTDGMGSPARRHRYIAR